MISCPNCGGNLKFDIPSQQMACEYCQSFFDPYSFDNKSRDAEESTSFEDNYEVTVFTCPQCGGEILSTDNAAAGFCSFCGASTILYSRISNERRPNYIIPFKKTKEDCKQAYAQKMRHALFAPKELKDPKAIDSFRGIYIPYWAFYITQKGAISLEGTTQHRSGDYICTDHFQLTGDMDSYYKGLSYDASSSFADSISEALAPYDLKGMKAFTPAYLSGFYADTADVPASVYQTDAESTASQEALAAIKKEPTFAHYTIDADKIYNPSHTLHTKTEQVDSTMFPVWFMSYRKNDRVAYTTVNGQTGKVVADIPIDPKKYALGSLILALPIFVLLAAFFTLLPTRLLTISAILAVLTTIIYTAELSAIQKKDSFSGDKGKLYLQDPEQLEQQNHKASLKVQGKNTGKKNLSIVKIFVFFQIGMVVLNLLASVIGSASSGSALSSLLWLVIIIAMAITIGVGSDKMKSLPSGQSVVGFIASGIAVAVSSVIALLHPVSDLYYYAGTIFVLIAVILSITDVIHYYNILSTRRLPQFDKQGGDDRA